MKQLWLSSILIINWMHRRPVSSILRDTFWEMPKGLMDGLSSNSLYLYKIELNLMNNQMIYENTLCKVMFSNFYLENCRRLVKKTNLIDKIQSKSTIMYISQRIPSMMYLLEWYWRNTMKHFNNITFFWNVNLDINLKLMCKTFVLLQYLHGMFLRYQKL